MNTDNLNLTAIRFKNVRQFRLKTGIRGQFRQALGNITFDELDTFILTGTPFDVSDDLLEMILKNKHIKVFKTEQAMTNEQLERLVRELPELQERTVCIIEFTISISFS